MCGHSYLKPKQEELRWDIIDAHDRLWKLQRQYQDEYKSIEEKKYNKDKERSVKVLYLSFRLYVL